jgi:alpha-beta hydrolase superfamily lysophospholipase
VTDPARSSDSTPSRPRSRWRLWFIRIVRLYLLYLLVLFVFQRAVIFPGQYREAPRFSAAELQASGGRALPLPNGGKAWWFVGRPGSPVIAIYHGNGELIEDWWELATRWQQQGHGVLLTEYPGYGGMPGPPNREGMLAQAREALEAIRGETHGPMIALGVSLGSGVATTLASEGRFSGIILVAPYTSLGAMARRRLAPGFLVRDRFDNVAALRNCSLPLLLVHGGEDKLIPSSMSLALSDAASGPVELVILEGIGHSGVIEGPFLDRVERWIAATFPPANGKADTSPRSE